MLNKKITDRIDVRGLTENQIKKLDAQVVKLGLKSRSEYIRLIIELDSATGLLNKLRGGN